MQGPLAPESSSDPSDEIRIGPNGGGPIKEMVTEYASDEFGN